MYDELVKDLRENHDKYFARDMQAADAIVKLQGSHYLMKKTAEWLAEKVPRWIPVTERLPDRGESVLVYRRDDNRVQPKMRIDVCPYLGDGIFCLLGVAYWMPLPQPPKEETC